MKKRLAFLALASVMFINYRSTPTSQPEDESEPEEQEELGSTDESLTESEAHEDYGNIQKVDVPEVNNSKLEEDDDE